ncbi:MAG: DUF2520 domain-containing protein [Gemmatimonadetes bacterium]|nr:DUF2520 domain-containing protein [Gemmatimonadota bacterium]
MGLTMGGLVLESGLAARVDFFGRRAAPPQHILFERPSVFYSTRFPGPAPRNAVVLVAVPDAAVPEAAASLAEAGVAPNGTVALHLSGVLPASSLGALRSRGYAIGSLHPLQTVAEPGGGLARLRGIAFAFEGEPAARGVAEAIAEVADGRLLEVRASEKPKYHAACVFAANYVVASMAVAARLLAEAAAIPERDALAALLPLLEGARANLERLGLPGALTGPVVRGDLETVRLHLAALDAPTRALYSALARETLRLARQAGLEPGRAQEIARLLEAAE